MLLPPIWQRRGGVVVGYRDFPNHFYRSKCNGLLYLQVAGIIFASGWIESSRGNQHKEKPPVVAATGGFVLPLNNHFPNDILQPHYRIYQIRLQYS